MQHTFRYLIWIAYLVFALPTNSLQAQTFSINGRVLSQDSVPQAGFKIQLFAQAYLLSESKTDNNGKFSFTSLTIPQCQIFVHKMGVRKKFSFSYDQSALDSTVLLDLYLDLNADSLLQLARIFQLGQGHHWFLDDKESDEKMGLISIQQFLNSSYSVPGEVTYDPVLIMADRPYGGNPTVGTISNRAVANSHREVSNMQGGLAAITQIIPTPDASETNLFGIRSRPPLPNLNDRNKIFRPEASYPNAKSSPLSRPEIQLRILSLTPPPIVENDQTAVSLQPFSTFSIDVDHASYTQLRAFIESDILPPASSIRTEELINYFDYQYPQPKDDHPIALDTEVSPCPWNSQNQLVRISLKAKEVTASEVPPSSFVFLIDVSGSMEGQRSLPLLKKALSKMVRGLRKQDQVAIVVYAGASGVALPLTKGNDQQMILTALNQLTHGGSTNGGEGIKLAYKIAAEAFIKDGNNRVILCTDGDFNVGLRGTDELVDLIKRGREKGIFLSALRVGYNSSGNEMMEQISKHGNGVYHYLDSDAEAERVLVKNFLGTTFTIAKDVKIQIELGAVAICPQISE